MDFDTRFATNRFLVKHPAGKPQLISNERDTADGGLRKQGYVKDYQGVTSPVISIVTVVLNDSTHIKDTIESVITQSYPCIEYIVVDGGSADGTLKIIQEYDSLIDYWVSGPDEGIWDAMNKGAALCTGSWINFMNSGDSFHAPDTVKRLFEEAPENADLIYGGCNKLFSNFSRVQEAGDIRGIWKSTVFWHQSLFARSELVRTHPFDISTKYSADHEFTIKAYKEGYRFHRSDIIVANVSAGGFTDVNRIPVIKEQWKTVRRYYPKPVIDIYYIFFLLQSRIKMLVKKVLPQRTVDYFIKRKRTPV